MFCYSRLPGAFQTFRLTLEVRAQLGAHQLAELKNNRVTDDVVNVQSGFAWSEHLRIRKGYQMF